MSKVFISPSNQYFNRYYDNNGNEGLYMNLLSDVMVPYFLLNGIETARRDKNSTVAEAISESNIFRPDLHIALHSNASPDESAGQNTGPEIYYFTESKDGKAAAEAIADEIAKIYPNPDNVKVIPVRNELAELSRTTAPSVYVEVAYHDNPDDSEWIVNNLDAIGRAIVRGTINYLDNQ
ncbi:MAG: N-acetylmuramoyl-L-alanine amidase [Clostridia bacterium]|nr:N-acetylmuramoyl-L-alanine amidase [Clostridia bacterium]